MHKYLINRAHLVLELVPVSAFAVRTGDKASPMLHPELPDLAVLRQDERVFIPGSSLKGVFRSHIERLLRSLAEGLACDPLVSDGPCQVSDRREPAVAIHRRQCLACRTFGSMNTAGRTLFTDAFSTEDTPLSQRSGVSIDRKTGGPARGRLFDMEVVSGGRFQAEIHLKNFQGWQLALIAATVQDLSAGLLRVGAATTRGLGAFEPTLVEFTHWQARGQTSPAGVGLLRPDLVADYAWLGDCSIPARVGAPHRGGLRWRWKGEDIDPALEAWIERGWSALDEASAA